MRVQLAAAALFLATIVGATIPANPLPHNMDERSLQDATETPSAAPAMDHSSMTSPAASPTSEEDPFGDSSDDPDAAEGETTQDEAAESAGHGIAGSILSTGVLAAGMQLMW